MFGKFHLWSHSVQNFCLLGVFFLIASISWIVIGLRRFSDSFWFSFGRLYVSRNLSILSRLSIQLFVIFCYNFSISVVLVVPSPFSLVILFTCPLCFLDKSGKGLSILFIFSKKLLLVSLVFCIFLDYFVYVLIFNTFSSTHFVFYFFLEPLCVKLECLFQIFSCFLK